MPADDRLWAENCNRAEDGREPTIEPNKQKLIVLLSCGRLDTCRRSTMSCWRRIRISVRSFVLGLKSEAMIWRISRSNSIIKWQGYRVSASRLVKSNFRYAQGDLSLNGRCSALGSMLRTAGTTAGGARFTVRNACYVREPDQMPWTANDAERHTHKATTLALKELWAKVANESLERTGDEGRAIREANAVVARQAGTSK